MKSEPNTIFDGCEVFRKQLQALQRELPALLNQSEDPITPDVATHYNQAMFHLQAAREELHTLQQKSKTP